MLTFLMFAAVIGFAVVMRERTKHKDDYRYEAAQYLMMGIIWGLIALSDYLDYGVRMPYFGLRIAIFVFSLFMCIRSILNHK
ncbi:hypothetical protein [uncultured Catenibacterium sp.]|uniref:hypothetical protein n=1 Tax=uncultured Catenibacterium sp. TaxID=286142 RepID=UPI0025ECA1C9|nr:hypothetical protein [uncultured Catenibacterium sp.]